MWKRSCNIGILILQPFTEANVYLGTSKDLIDEPISAEVTTDSSQVANRIFLIQNPLAIDEIIVQVQNSGARAVIYISPVYCKLRVPAPFSFA
jgi:hypothetical protein